MLRTYFCSPAIIVILLIRDQILDLGIKSLPFPSPPKKREGSGEGNEVRNKRKDEDIENRSIRHRRTFKNMTWVCSKIPHYAMYSGLGLGTGEGHYLSIELVNRVFICNESSHRNTI
jgi:hypothetical protein